MTPAPTPQTHTFKRPPRSLRGVSKQLEAFLKTADEPAYALLMEQRVGKSHVVINTADYQYTKYRNDNQTGINGLVIIAMPGRVHRNWTTQELPADLASTYSSVTWEAGKANTKYFRADLENLLTTPALAILAVNGEAILTETFRVYLARFLKARKRVMLVADEFTLLMKTPGAKRTKLMRIIGRQPQVVMKRILDGTPMETPLDLYAPFAFLDPAIIGFTSFTAFKHHFAKWKKETAWSTGQTYETLDRGPDDDQSPWLNLDELQAKIAKKSFRALRSECFDVHDKTYQTATFILTPKQRKVYDDLASSLEAELPSGLKVSVKHVLTRYLRLQQITSGFYPQQRLPVIHPPCNGDGCPDCADLGVVIGFTPLERIDTTDPRLDAYAGIIERNAQDQIITWARFHEDVDATIEQLKKMGRSPVQYDGRCGPGEKDAALAAFQGGAATDLVGNPRSGGRGIKLTQAKLIINYSNEFALLTRLQSEDRAEGPDRAYGTGIVDLAAEDTIDDLIIIPALRGKKSVYDYVMNERNGRWL